MDLTNDEIAEVFNLGFSDEVWARAREMGPDPIAYSCTCGPWTPGCYCANKTDAENAELLARLRRAEAELKSRG